MWHAEINSARTNWCTSVRLRQHRLRRTKACGISSVRKPVDRHIDGVCLANTSQICSHGIMRLMRKTKRAKQERGANIMHTRVVTRSEVTSSKEMVSGVTAILSGHSGCSWCCGKRHAAGNNHCCSMSNPYAKERGDSLEGCCTSEDPGDDLASPLARSTDLEQQLKPAPCLGSTLPRKCSGSLILESISIFA